DFILRVSPKHAEFGTVERALKIGAVEILALRDCVLPLRRDFQFPEAHAADFAPFRERYPGMLSEDRWLAPVPAFLIRTPRETVLFDSGLGALGSVASVFNVRGSLPDELRREGSPPEAIETVVLSHLHLDHAGGVMRARGAGAEPTFPRARHLLHPADLELARQWGKQYSETVLEVEARGLLDAAADGLQLGRALSLLHTPGHTPGSMSVLVLSRGEGALLSADAIPNPMLATEPQWRVGSDSDPAQASATRIALMDRIESEGLVSVPTHMPEPFGGFVRVGGKRYWRGRN